MIQTIAIVEDDRDQRHYYAEALRAHGYEVSEYEDREQAIAAFEQALPELAILDIALKTDVGGGYEVCRYLQQRDATLPVIFLTSRGDELDKIYGLQLGAWDYQTKPVSLEFLIVRIESFLQIKQLNSNAAAVRGDDANQRFGDLKINSRAMVCHWKDQEVNLTPTEFSLLQAMLDAAHETGQGVSVDDLIKATRQGIVEENTISTHILHIRKKFKKIDTDFQCIKTRYGLGYQWMCS